MAVEAIAGTPTLCLFRSGYGGTEIALSLNALTNSASIWCSGRPSSDNGLVRPLLLAQISSWFSTALRVFTSALLQLLRVKQ